MVYRKICLVMLYKALEARRKILMDKRQKGHQDLELAQHKAKEALDNAQKEVDKILTQANQAAI